MTYLELLNDLRIAAEVQFAAFQRKLIFTDYTILGVRTPWLRKKAKELRAYLDEVLSFPDEYYEVVFIKLSLIAALPFDDFLKRVEYAVSLMDNWALCDCFKAGCILKNRQAFLLTLDKLFCHGGEYYERYVLVTLLAYYVETEYLPLIRGYTRRADTSIYYVHMAVAWLVAEILTKQYEEGVAILGEGFLDKKTHNKSIQKAIESYRITKERKEFLRSLKIK